jgi:hypothetical protein
MDKMMHDEIHDGTRDAKDILRDLLTLKSNKPLMQRAEYKRQAKLLWAQADHTVDSFDRPLRKDPGEAGAAMRTLGGATITDRPDLARDAQVAADENRNGGNSYEQLRHTIKVCLEAAPGILEVHAYNFGPGDPTGLQVRTAGGVMAYIHITGDDTSRR